GPYRFGSITHVQVLSSWWMPLALLGFHRFFTTRRSAPLALAAAAWVAQNLSCAYYLMFFSLSAALYVAWELTARRLWTDWRTLGRLLVAGAVVGLATAPFVMPYVTLRHLGFGPRSLAEAREFGADVLSYLTADPRLWLWGRIMRAFPKSEGSLFPGLTVIVLAMIGLWKSGIRESGFGNRDLGIGIRESGFGNRDLGIG